MIRSVWILLILYCQSTSLQAHPSRRIPLDSLLRLGLPVAEVVTVDSIEPTAEEAVKPDERCSGRTIVNATKVPGRIIIWAADSTRLYDSGEYDEGRSGMTIKIRGNNSALRDTLKPYKVKLQKKGDLLVRGNPLHYRDKNWLLMKEWHNTLNTPVGLKVNELLGQSWTPSCRQVNVLFNGEYRGIYLLVEQVRRNERCRIDVDERTGYILERDIYWWAKPLSFETPQYNGYWQRYTFKYPDEDEVTDAQVGYIRQAMEEMEEAVYDPYGEYGRYLDAESHAAWVLGHDILGTKDGGGANRYLSKYDDTPESKIRMETIWDFDTNFMVPDEWSALHDSYHTYAHYLFLHHNRLFAKAYVEAWERVSPVLEERMGSFLDSLAVADSAALNASRRLEAALGYRTYISFQENLDEAQSWFARRKRWLDEQVALIDTVDIHDGIRDLPSPLRPTFGRFDTSKNSKPSSLSWTGLSGRRLSTPPTRPGLYIKDGRKLVIK